LRLPPEAVRLRTAQQFGNDNASGIMDLAWQSALRLIENQQPDYRQ